ncbi:MAG: nompc, trpn1 [Gammaproteobacteria bacterium]|jgi:hypothetical protein|nr:nompc, trpn1 [Gammaproteobacteria bacterium]
MPKKQRFDPDSTEPFFKSRAEEEQEPDMSEEENLEQNQDQPHSEESYFTRREGTQAQQEMNVEETKGYEIDEDFDLDLSDLSSFDNQERQDPHLKEEEELFHQQEQVHNEEFSTLELDRSEQEQFGFSPRYQASEEEIFEEERKDEKAEFTPRSDIQEAHIQTPSGFALRGIDKLEEAIARGDRDAVQQSLGNMVLRKPNGETPLHLAAKAGDPVIIESLIKASPLLPKIKDDNDNTPLHVAAKNKDWSTSSQLLHWEPTLLEARNKEGNTALHFAAQHAQNGSPQLALVLLEKGANPYIPNEKGETPLEILMQKMESAEDLRMLEQYFEKLSKKAPHNKIYRSAIDVLDTAATLAEKISCSRNNEEKKAEEQAELNRFLSLAKIVIVNPTKAEPATALADALVQGAPGKPSRWKEMFGALAKLTGTVLKAINAVTPVPSKAAGEKLSQYGQNTMFHHEQYRKLSKALDKLAHFNEEPPAAPKARR